MGVFPAISGDGVYKNRGGCTAIAGKGPIPSGKYWIVARPVGGIGSQAITHAKDLLSNLLADQPTGHDVWFALYRDDGLIDDWTWVKGVKRGNFRLHPKTGAGVSYGCITLTSVSDFQRVRHALLHTPTIAAGSSGILAYGWIEVVTIGNTCPQTAESASIYRVVPRDYAFCPTISDAAR
ncbi:DUF2778 domain-containing protein [Caballeronia hypogeia]|uniref:DUF2778 domain-containing protein n=1 Tax=Caballeronia hypogeia TaxID=1777140 RepID=UPI0009412064